MSKVKEYFNFGNLKGDISGALAAAVISITGNIVYGIISFAPLGPKYVGAGIVAGMFSTIFNGLLATIFGNTKIMISGPVNTAAFIFASVITNLFSIHGFDPENQLDMLSIISITFFVVFLSGIFQILFGLLRLGTLVKNISYPVILGIVNGTSILIILSQLGPGLGIKLSSSGEIFSKLGQTSIPTLIVTVFTLLIMFFANKHKTRVPSSILSVLGGTLLYHLLKLAIPPENLGPVVGEMPFAIPSLSNLVTFINIFPEKVVPYFFPIIIPAAFAMAILGSIKSLLTIVMLQNFTQSRPQGNRELIAQGIGNSIGAIFGGIMASGYLAHSTVNYTSGGRTKLSGVFCGLICLLFILFLGKPIGYIPNSVMAAIVIFICVELMNNPSVQIAKKLFQGRTAERGELLLDFSIILTVMVVAMVFNLVLAVAIGILVSIIIFIAQMSRSIIREIHRGSQINSKKQRFEKSREILLNECNKIFVVELEGAIFFGSADNLVDEIEKLVQAGGQYIVLDMKRVTRIDSTGCKILEQTYRLLTGQKIDLAISYIDKHSPLWNQITEQGLVSVLGEKRLFADTSLAVESFEDRILEEFKGDLDSVQEISLDDFLKFKGIGEKERKIVADYLEKVEFSKNERIITLGDTERSMYLLVKGSVDIVIPISKERKKRLQTNAFGSMFGEMSLIDGSPRSADIIACEPSKCFKLSLENFNKLKSDYPNVALELYATIALITAAKLRAASYTISELEA